MSNKNNIQKYKDTARVVSKAQQIILLYEGAIRFLNKARIASAEKNFQERYNSLEKVTQILNGLSISLDYEKNKEVALALDQFYHSLYSQLMSLHHDDDMTVYDTVEGQLNLVLKAWKEIDIQTKSLSPSDSNDKNNYSV